MLLKIEIKNIGYGTLIAEVVCFFGFIIFVRPVTAVWMGGFLEFTITVLSTITCAYAVYCSGDMEILIPYRKSVFQILLDKYCIINGSLYLLALIEIAGYLLVVRNMEDLTALFGFISSSAFLSGFAVLASVLFRSSDIGIAVTVFTVPFGMYIGNGLSRFEIPQWYEYVSFFDTLYMYRSPLWLTNRILLLCAAVAVWVLLSVLLRSKRWKLKER